MQIGDFLLGSNKKATKGWAALSGRSHDIVLNDYVEAGDWSVACNQSRIDAGSIGWIIRADGEWGHVAGVLAVSNPPEEQVEPGGTVWYVPGALFPLPREWWIDGARLHLAGWPQRAPFGAGATGRRMAVFRSGEALPQGAVELLDIYLHPVAREWVQRRRSGA